jgi:phage head maturation protease
MAVNQARNDDWDFTGYATKANIKCTDGRTIAPDAFKHMDGQQVTLVWRHLQHEPSNILGHGILQAYKGDMLVHGRFNSSPSGRDAKTAVQHGDINSLSIYANELIETDHIVHSGNIVEVSLVVSGANPGAKITNVSFRHEDTGEETVSDQEAVISMGIPFSDEEDENDDSEKEEDETNMRKQLKQEAVDDPTVGDVFESLTDEQKEVVYALVAQAVGDTNTAAQADESEGENFMSKNIFENEVPNTYVLSHEDEAAIFAEAQRNGSLRDTLMHVAPDYGIENIDYLFPDARTVGDNPALIKRDTAWVTRWMSGTNHTPFSRIKTMGSDITADTARALGYVKAGMKKEIVLGLLRRTTTPTTVYIKAKLDRDDIVDVTMDVVGWQQRIMRLNLDEEVARAALVGDGRPLEVNAAPNPDKINEDNIRPIYTDDELYAHRLVLEAADTTADIIDEMIAVREFYKGTGNPTLFTTTGFLTKMLLLKDEMGRRMYRSVQELASELRVSDIVEVPVLSGVSRVDTEPTPDVTINLLGILVNPVDYTYGADKGGGVASFEDFDIDYNQMKWLMETRCSGALTLPKSAVIVEQKAAPVAG